MAVVNTLEALCQNIVSIIYIHNEYILVASTGCHREFFLLVCLYLVTFIHCSHNKLCFSVMLFSARIFGYILVSIFLVGCYILCIFLDLCEVDLGCGLSSRHFVDVFCRVFRPSIKVAPVDGSCLFVLYRTECRSMYKLDDISLAIYLMYAIVLVSGSVKVF